MSSSAVSFPTRVALWGRSGGMCAFDDCRMQLVMWAEDASDPSLVGDVCHIVAKEDDGPRALSPMSLEDRNGYSNLVLLCKIHHKLADDNEAIYTVERLLQIKAQHEQWVRSSLSKEGSEQQAVREQYSTLIAGWEAKSKIGDWDSWANSIVDWYPTIRSDTADMFERLPSWIDTRWWPGKLPLLEAAIINYSKWLRLTLSVLYKHTRLERDEHFTPKFYQFAEWDEEKYNRLYDVWLKHLKLLEQLMIEVCKAANLIAKIVRAEISSAYRHEEGKFALADTFEDSGSLFKGVFEYAEAEIGDGLIFQRSKLFHDIAS